MARVNKKGVLTFIDLNVCTQFIEYEVKNRVSNFYWPVPVSRMDEGKKQKECVNFLLAHICTQFIECEVKDKELHFCRYICI